MTRNVKIALGCGGAGCLGLLVVIAASAILYFYLDRQPMVRNSNRNSNFNINTNNQDSNNNSSTDSSDEISSSMSDDDKHKLFQAAGMTQDNQLIVRVLQKIGFGSGVGSGYEAFVKDHVPWAVNNLEFINSVNTPEKARAYVEEHLDD